MKSETLIHAMNLAAKTRQALDESGTQLALIARAGQDLTKHGLRYSHLAYAWRDHPQGRWLVVHELNHCGSAESALYDEGLGNFFLDNMFAYETRLVFPGPEQQARLAQVLGGKLAQRLHEPHYNMLAWPFATRYQNSNQWVLEVWAAAQMLENVPGNAVQETADGKLRAGPTRSQAQSWLRAAGYKPGVVHISAMTRLGARMFRANVAFDDQPTASRMAGDIQVVTADSVFDFVLRKDKQASSKVLVLQ